MYNLDPCQLSSGLSLRDVWDMRYAAGTGPDMPPQQYAAWRDRIRSPDHATDTEVTLRNGRVHAIHYEPTLGGGWVATCEDITGRRRAEARVWHMAHYDALTDLPNRTLFTERLERTLARLHGENRLEDYQRVISVVSAPYMLDGHEARVGTSIGITFCARGDVGVEPALLFRQADIALYQAKAKGRGNYCFFQAGMEAVLHRRNEMEQDLRRALAQGELEVHFQPLVALASMRIVGAEALARWKHPEHGIVPPAEFIPLAERAELIGELGAWMLRAACALAACWDGLCVAVNLSPEQVRRPGLVELVTTVLAETGLTPSRLELEITEGLLLHETAVTLATLTRLRALGVGIALDDFGTGYSSLSYLRRFPFTKLKVDRSFVAGMAGDAGAAAIVQAVITLGRSLAMRVSAEGIEIEEQLGLLRAMGCDEGQGYLLGRRPCPTTEFEQQVAS